MVRQEIQRLTETVLPSSEVRTFFVGAGGSSEEFSTRDELLVMLASEAGHSRVTFVVPDPDSYSSEPDLLEAGGISFEVIDAAPPGWEGMWWWPLQVGGRPDPIAMRSPRYHSMLDAMAVSLRERQGESLGVFGLGSSMPQVRLRATEFWEDGTHLPVGFSKGWWARFVGRLGSERAPVKWLGSDDPMIHEALEVQQAGRSPLSYDRSGNVQRLSLVDSEAPDFEKGDLYFAQQARKVWLGKTGRRLKNPREEIIPGAAPGTVAFLDYHDMGDGYIYVDYMKTRNDMRGMGHARRLIDELIKVFGRDSAYDFGKMMNPAIGKIYDDLKSQGLRVYGHRDY